MNEVGFTETEAKAIIKWLVHLLGGAVTIPDDPQFWDDNYPNAELGIINDPSGNAVLVVDYLTEE